MNLSFLLKLGFGTVILFLIAVSTRNAGLINVFVWLLFIVFLLITVLLIYLGISPSDNNQGDTE
jgi:membrane protein implicated in regulation of membrane protease activity